MPKFFLFFGTLVSTAEIDYFEQSFVFKMKMCSSSLKHIHLVPKMVTKMSG